ncbi:hypothetical protein JOD43_003830 [Pullulanibacillus pueri]|uniref:Uncharacterized protein n=1 Tax=Pullulanibacillus pueri TaxID=1437324 RepID=A0A8J2ZZ89_9BACL|nr:hypothetical protein [Pullulanibacillus pueri]MBM7683650.1 hypothetical protein [Pullulanibacillus pueri]GGH87222.1 hypothetical protein GCM10007096_36740 [Pullulanibacillus pueri]
MNKYFIERLMWSIALPGLGQYLNKKYIKGTVFLTLEFLINIKSHFNLIILQSFHGEISNAIHLTNYQWLMFYPCVYFFSIWDAVKDSGGGKNPYAFLPYVCSGYLVTLGLIFSEKWTLFGILLGPVFLPISLVLPGIVIGWAIKQFLNRIA